MKIMNGMKGMMIGGIIAIFLLVVSVGAVNNDVPNLEGNWTVVTYEGQSFLSDHIDESQTSIHMSSCC